MELQFVPSTRYLRPALDPFEKVRNLGANLTPVQAVDELAHELAHRIVANMRVNRTVHGLR